MEKNWHDSVFFGIHFDWHATLTDSNIGQFLTIDYFENFLKEIQPDWIQVDCKGHPGISSWPTKIGITPDNLTTDHLKICSDVAEKLNIPLGIHYSGVIDEAQVKLHPEWAVVNNYNKKDLKSTCPLSEYDKKFMINHILEITNKYNISNIWVDGECWGAKTCWCDRCKTSFKKIHGFKAPQTIQDNGWELFLEFHRNNFVAHVKTYEEAIHKANPNLLICSNWMYSARMPQSITVNVDYLSGDFDPAWGVARAATESRMLDCRRRDFNLSWDLMLWTFPKSYDKPTPMSCFMKPLTHMCQEASEVLAHSGAIMIYDVPERNGIIPEWKREYYKKLKNWCNKYRENCFDTKSASNVAIFHTETHMKNFVVKQKKYCNETQGAVLFDSTFACQSIEGALHFALETGKSCDIVTEDSIDKLSNYQLLIVPEHVAIAPHVFVKLQSYVANGGNIIFSGCKIEEQTQKLLGVKILDNDLPKHYCAEVINNVLLLPEYWADAEIIESDVSCLKVRLNGFSPEHSTTSFPLATKRNYGKGQVVGVYGDIFREYYLSHYLPIRNFINELYDTMNIQLKYNISKDSVRSYIELIARQKGNDLMLNIINRGARETLSANRPILDEIVPINDIIIEFASDISKFSISSTNGSDISVASNRIKIDKIEIYEIIRVKDFFIQ